MGFVFNPNGPVMSARGPYNFRENGIRGPVGGSSTNVSPQTNGGSASENPGGGASGSSGGSGGGGNAPPGVDFVTSPNGTNSVAVPAPVTFDPNAYYISLDQALGAAHAEGERNLDQYKKNFDTADKYTSDILDTEARGLESFIPRTSKLIRSADAQGNQDILNYSDVFDARNAKATQRATLDNVALRKSVFDEANPGLRNEANAQRGRAEGDVSRIRAREAEPYLDQVLKDSANRKARNMGADVSAASGFGSRSSAGINMIDRFDVDSRIRLRDAEIANARAGDSSIQNAENQVTNSITSAENLFNGVIAPGIKDFQPLQVQPRVTDIGGQIRVMPARDAGSIREGITDKLTSLSTISPSQVLQGSLSTQEYNSGVGIQALGFQQAQNNTAANAVNAATGLDKADDHFNAQLDAHQAGLAQQTASQNNQATAGLVTAGAGVLAPLIQSWLGTNDPNQKTSIGQRISSVLGNALSKGGQAVYDGITGWIGSTFGNDVAAQVGNVDANFGGGGATSGVGGGGGSGGVTVRPQEVAQGNTGSFSGGSASIGSETNNGDNEISQGTQDHFDTISSGDTFDMSAEGGGTDSNTDLGSPDFDWNAGSAASQPTDISLPEDLDFSTARSGNTSKGVALATVQKESSGVTPLAKKDVVASFKDPDLREGIMDKAKSYGITAQNMLAAYNLYDNWDKLSDTERAYQSGQLLNSLATSAGVIEGTIPGAVVSTIYQSSNLYKNWDKMTDGQRVAAGTQITGGMAGLAAGMTFGGPIGAAVVFGASAIAKGAQVAIDEGLSSNKNINTVLNPGDSYGNSLINGYTHLMSDRDNTNFSMLHSPLAPLAISNMLFHTDLDFTSGKNRTQQFRDALRGNLQKQGVLDDKYQVTLAKGDKFDLGKDGGAKLENYGKNIDGKTTRSYSDVDFSNPNSGEVVGWANALSRIMFKSNEGGKFVGNLTNAAMSSDPLSLSSAKDNLKFMATNGKLDYAQGSLILDAMYGHNEINKSEYDSYKNGWMNLMLL